MITELLKHIFTREKEKRQLVQNITHFLSFKSVLFSSDFWFAWTELFAWFSWWRCDSFPGNQLIRRQLSETVWHLTNFRDGLFRQTFEVANMPRVCFNYISLLRELFKQNWKLAKWLNSCPRQKFKWCLPSPLKNEKYSFGDKKLIKIVTSILKRFLVGINYFYLPRTL